ncbi:MAG: hypothetical protein IJK29_05155 [Bacteroidales bacterium]|nr:hypothetical protein [Bacteroidales bacterium]
MKDTLITAHRKLVELKTAGVCLLLAVLLNIGCIIYYHTPFYEVFTQIGYTVVIALGFYVIWTAIRLIVWLFRKKK